MSTSTSFSSDKSTAKSLPSHKRVTGPYVDKYFDRIGSNPPGSICLVFLTFLNLLNYPVICTYC